MNHQENANQNHEEIKMEDRDGEHFFMCFLAI
jgi:uncharacterized C2H2 Zn-finger protein